MHAVARSVLLGLALPSAAAAHHSFFGRFDTQTLVELEGEVTEVLWRNPHAYFSVRADGVLWEIETSSLTVLKRMGIEPGTVRVGDRIRIAANPPLGDKKEMYARHVLLPDGRELLMNVGLTPRWAERANAVGDQSLLMAREGDGSRPGARPLSRLEPHAYDRTLVPRRLRARTYHGSHPREEGERRRRGGRFTRQNVIENDHPRARPPARRATGGGRNRP